MISKKIGEIRVEKKENEEKSFGLSKDVVPPLGEGPSVFLGLAKVDF